jgi:hypothetical protein
MERPQSVEIGGSMKRIASLIFHAPLGDTNAERLVEGGRWAATLDLARRLRAAGLSENYVLTPTPGRCPGGADAIAFLPTAAEAFDFGRVLKRAIAELGLDGVLYFGSGAGGLLSEGELARLIEFARGGATRGLFNNFYSCDFCSVSGARELLRIDLPAIDNPLGFSLADAGIPCFSLARNAATQFDIDTPADLFLLERSGLGGPALQQYCAALEMEHPTLDRALGCLTDRAAVTCLVGRLSPVTWSHFEAEVACRTSALVEGRGMRAGSSPHVPWLRQALSDDGPEAFFDRLARSCDAAWIDTRPLLPATEAGPPASERFSSDLFDVSGVIDPAWRAFTAAALRARVPVVLGGHSVVSGGLYLAAAACWKGRDVARRLHPEPFV